MTQTNNGSPSNDLCIPNIIIKSAFRSLSGSINICHINSCSIFRKMDQLRRILLNTNIHIICVSETWLNTSYSDEMVKIEGFRIIRHDRSRCRGGGIAVYIKTGISSKILDISPATSTLEFMFVEIVFGNFAFLVGLVYNPPSNSDFSNFEQSLTSVSHIYDDIILTGDFNVNICVSSSKTRSLLFSFCLVWHFQLLIRSLRTYLLPHCTLLAWTCL